MLIRNDEDCRLAIEQIETKLRGEGLTPVQRLAQYPSALIVAVEHYQRHRR